MAKATLVFLDHRDLLFSMVYNRLGNVADTEDVLQETWLSWACRDNDDVCEPRAYLVRIALNHALKRRAGIARRREWGLDDRPGDFPATAGGDGTVERVDEVSAALLTILETLTPVERVVFVLHEVFDQPHTDIARLLGRTPQAVRQLAHRARKRVHSRHPRRHTSAGLHRQISAHFQAAAAGGDLRPLIDALAPRAAGSHRTPRNHRVSPCHRPLEATLAPTSNRRR